jgi:hypothetical protein
VSAQFARHNCHRSIVPAPIKDVSLSDPVRGQHATCVLRIDGQVGARADFGSGEATLWLKFSAIETEGTIMISEAQRDTICP